MMVAAGTSETSANCQAARRGNPEPRAMPLCAVFITVTRYATVSLCQL
jgi:hypothetical protein